MLERHRHQVESEESKRLVDNLVTKLWNGPDKWHRLEGESITLA